MSFLVEGPKDAQITVELEEDTEYAITIDGVNAGQMKTNLGGKLSFAIATARATWSYRNQRVELVFDGEPASRVELTVNTVAVANGRFFGGGMMMAPDADVEDGTLDVVCMGDFGFGDLLRSGRRLYKGTHLTMDKVSHRRAKLVEALPMDPSEAVELDVDGENLGRLPARFEVAPAAIWMAAPPR